MVPKNWPAIVGYLIATFFGVALVRLPHTRLNANQGALTWTESIVYFSPLAVAGIWGLIGTWFRPAWSLDRKVNADARKHVRDNVIAGVVLLAGLIVPAMMLGNEVIEELIDKMSTTFLGLFVVYPWLGLVRAVLATHWTRGAIERANAPD